jgi:hypothetical protein
MFANFCSPFRFSDTMEAAYDMTRRAFRHGVFLRNTSWDLWRYGIDLAQRSVLMSDVLRRRGNQYFDYQEAGLPPITPFPLEKIMDGRDLDRPVNRTLVRVTDRRTADTGRRSDWADQTKRPIIFQDPDAGRGLISASRETSEMGLSIDTGHPTFLILVQPETVRGQTMDDLVAATRIFAEKVRELCPHEKPPAFIGNCQAGWQMALSAARTPGIEGPVVPVGAPLSYWSRGAERHSLRFAGGLSLGTWLPLFLGDIGDDVIDALPPLNFELFDIDRHPILDSLKWLQEVDDEQKIGVFLTQQKWVYGFYQIGARQFCWIIRELFVGNKLERGLVELEGRPVDMKNIKSAIIFTSYGDTITPVPQGIGWIPRVWSSTDEIKEAGVKLVLVHHQRAGHLAIFVSARVADKEHREIIGVLGDDLDDLEPGLYQMEITTRGDHPPRYTTDFREIDLEEIRETLDDSDRPLFHRAAVVSEAVDRLYRITARPWVRMAGNAVTAGILHRLHPMRSRVSAWSDRRNPFAYAIRTGAEEIRKHRLPVGPDHPFSRLERLNRGLLGVGLNLYKEIRDSAYETTFHLIYGDANPWMKFFLPADLFADDTVDPEDVARRQFSTLFLGAEEPPKSLSLIPPVNLYRRWLNPAALAGGFNPPWSADLFDPQKALFSGWGLMSEPGEEAASNPPLFQNLQEAFWEGWSPWIAAANAFNRGEGNA